MSKIIVSLSEQDIRDLELGNKVWIPVNPNFDYSNLQEIAICKDSTNTVEEGEYAKKTRSYMKRNI